MKVLFVDAGNYCRSPVAEIVARQVATQGGMAGWEFASAGLKDKHAGDRADPRSIELCRRHGYDLSAFRCREITAADYGASDLILAMDRDNLAQLEARRPPGNATPIRLFLGESEVPDPYFGGVDGFDSMLALVEEGIRSLLAKV
jgi:protein-tyrosine phosphatase